MIPLTMKEYTTTLRVRYKETDKMQVVYYSNYLVWFEVARTELFRKLGCIYSDIEKDLGLYLMVADAHCRYLKPAYYDDRLEIHCYIESVGRSGLGFSYKVNRDTELLAEGETQHVFCDKKGKPQRIPEKVREVIS